MLGNTDEFILHVQINRNGIVRVRVRETIPEVQYARSQNTGEITKLYFTPDEVRNEY
jgi:hypothetical protein